MKIAFISLSVIPSTTANSIYAMKMCEAFKKNGHDAYLVVPRGGDPVSAIRTRDIYKFYGIQAKFPIIRASLKEPWSIVSEWGYSTFLDALKLKVDLVYSPYIKSAMFAALYRVPFIYEIHSDLAHDTERAALKMIKNSDSLIKIISTTRSLKEYLTGRFKIRNNRIVVLPNSVSRGAFLEMGARAALKGKAPCIGYCGHLYDGRGIDIILRLAKIMPGIKFNILGGNKEDIFRWELIRKKLKADNVSFKGFVAPYKIPACLSRIDILLMPYQKKVRVAGNAGNTVKWMSPMKMFDYMASGKPIIASDLPVLREILKDRKNCLMVHAQSVSKWRDAINFLLARPDFARKIAEKARKEVEDRYLWDIKAEKVLGFLRNRIDGPHS